MSERFRDLIAYVLAVAVLLVGSYLSARLDTDLVAGLRPHTATADAVGTEGEATQRRP